MIRKSLFNLYLTNVNIIPLHLEKLHVYVDIYRPIWLPFVYGGNYST